MAHLAPQNFTTVTAQSTVVRISAGQVVVSDRRLAEVAQATGGHADGTIVLTASESAPC